MTKGGSILSTIDNLVVISLMIVLTSFITSPIAGDGTDQDNRSSLEGPIEFSTYLGGLTNDVCAGISVDGQGRPIITGHTWSIGFPTTQDAYQRFPGGGGWDAFICVLDTDGSRLISSTLLGGGGADYASDVIVDSSGSIWVIGQTFSDDFPVSDSPYQGVNRGSGDAFICRLSQDLSTLEFSTYLGGEDDDRAIGISIDDTGNVIVTGNTLSENFVVTTNATNTSGVGTQNVFVSKLNPDLSTLHYSSIIGGSGTDTVTSMALGPSNDPIICGHTSSTDFPITPGASQETYGGGVTDAFILSVDSEKGVLNASTYLGGSAEDDPYGLTIDTDNNLWVAGTTSSIDFPTTDTAYEETFQKGGSDAFVTSIDPNGSTITYSTYLGGRKADRGIGIAIDPTGDFFIIGYTDSEDFPVQETSFQGTYSGGPSDMYLLKMNTSQGVIQYSTFIGGGSHDYCVDLELSTSGEVFVAGYSNSTDFPTTGNVFQPDFSGGEYDNVVCKFPEDLKRPFAEAGPDIVIDQHENATFDGSGSWDDREITGWKWTFKYDGIDISLSGSISKFRFDIAGRYTVILNVTDGSGNWATDRLNVTVLDITPPIAVAGTDRAIDQHEIVVLDGSGSSDNVGIANWTWRFQYNDTEYSLFGEVSSFEFIEAGEWMIILIVRDMVGLTGQDELNITVRDITSPVANAGDDSVWGYKTENRFNGSRSGDNVGISHYNWTFQYLGYTMYLYGESPSFIFDTLGEFIVELNVSDAYGNWDTDELTVRVIDIVAPYADAGHDQEVPQNTMVSLDGTASSDDILITNWTWSFEVDGNTIELFGPSPSYLFSEAGEYNISLRVSDQEGNLGTDSTVVWVVDITDPIAVAGSDRQVDQDQIVELDGTQSTDNLAITKWYWTVKTPGGDVELNGSIAQWSTSEVGMYEVTLHVQDLAGNIGTDSLNIHVKDITEPIARAGLDMSVELGERVHFDGSASEDNVGVSEWTWRFDIDGEPVVLSGERVDYRFESKGRIIIELTVTDEAGNIAKDTITVTVTSDETSDGNQALVFLLIILIVIVSVVILLRRAGHLMVDPQDRGDEPDEE